MESPLQVLLPHGPSAAYQLGRLEAAYEELIRLSSEVCEAHDVLMKSGYATFDREWLRRKFTALQKEIGRYPTPDAVQGGAQ